MAWDVSPNQQAKLCKHEHISIRGVGISYFWGTKLGEIII